MRRRDGEVDRERRPADPALGAEHRDDRPGSPLAGPIAAAATARAGNAGCVAIRDLVLLAGPDLADRRRELVGAERLHEELAGAGEHRAAEVVRLALDGHHDHGGGRHLRGQRSVAAMPSMSGMLMSIRTTSGQRGRHLDGLRPDAAAAPTTSTSASKPSSFER